MARSTSALRCPICGAWVSTDAPRTSFGGSTELARDIVYEKLSVHLQTYHTDYLAWSRAYQGIGAGLVLFFIVGVILWYALRDLLLLPLAVGVPLVIGVPLLFVYRRKFADLKERWIEEHPAGLSTIEPLAEPLLGRCPICGKSIPVEKGVSIDLRTHYKNDHPEYYRWQQKIKGIAFLGMIIGLAFVFLLAALGQQTLVLPGIVGILSVIILIAAYGAKRQKRFKSLWQAQHGT
jgi:hypothetical protein